MNFFVFRSSLQVLSISTKLGSRAMTSSIRARTKIAGSGIFDVGKLPMRMVIILATSL